MRCCEECFKDDLAKRVIAGLSSGNVDVCDLCGRSGVSVIDVSPESELAEQFFELLSVFSAAPDEDEDAYDSLFEAFYETWLVFEGVPREAFDSFLLAMFPGDGRIAELLAGKVKLDPSPDLEDRYSLGFFGEEDWESFSRDIKYRHRYHPKVHNGAVLERLLRALAIDMLPGERQWYRARNWNGKKKDELTVEELKEPPEGRSSEGRMSPRGVKCLYIADDPVGAIAEIRAARHDDVAVMEMVLNRPLHILDLSRIDGISPFDENVDCRELASNLKNLRQMKEALVKPMRSFDDELDYVPTQYIADYARSIGFDGIGFESVLHDDGEGKPSYNIASFIGFDDAFACSEIALYHIDRNKLEPTITYIKAEGGQ